MSSLETATAVFLVLLRVFRLSWNAGSTLIGLLCNLFECCIEGTIFGEIACTCFEKRHVVNARPFLPSFCSDLASVLQIQFVPNAYERERIRLFLLDIFFHKLSPALERNKRLQVRDVVYEYTAFSVIEYSLRRLLLGSRSVPNLKSNLLVLYDMLLRAKVNGG